MAGFSAEKALSVIRSRGKTPVAVADEMGISARTLGSWLTGSAQPRQSSLISLSRTLRVKVEDLTEEAE